MPVFPCLACSWNWRCSPPRLSCQAHSRSFRTPLPYLPTLWLYQTRTFSRKLRLQRLPTLLIFQRVAKLKPFSVEAVASRHLTFRPVSHPLSLTNVEYEAQILQSLQSPPQTFYVEPLNTLITSIVPKFDRIYRYLPSDKTQPTTPRLPSLSAASASTSAAIWLLHKWPRI